MGTERRGSAQNERGRQYAGTRVAWAGAALGEILHRRCRKRTWRSCERAVAAVNDRDIDAYLACCTPGHPVADPGGRQLKASTKGPKGSNDTSPICAMQAGDFRITIDRLETVGADRVVGFVRLNMSGRASGISLGSDIPATNVYDLADGNIKRVRIFLDPPQSSPKPWGCRSKTLTPTPEGCGILCGAMSQENVEIARAYIRRMDRRGHRCMSVSSATPISIVRDVAPDWPDCGGPRRPRCRHAGRLQRVRRHLGCPSHRT